MARKRLIYFIFASLPIAAAGLNKLYPTFEADLPWLEVAAGFSSLALLEVLTFYQTRNDKRTISELREQVQQQQGKIRFAYCAASLSNGMLSVLDSENILGVTDNGERDLKFNFASAADRDYLVHVEGLSDHRVEEKQPSGFRLCWDRTGNPGKIEVAVSLV